MPGCPNGAVAKPGYGPVNVAIDMLTAGILDILGLKELAPWLFDSVVLGTMETNALCQSNPPDPGDFSPSMLVVPPLYGAIPNPDAPAGTLNKWLWDKAYYYAFSQACQCADTGLPPPTPSPITPPTQVDPTPTAPGHEDQLTKILNNQGTSGDALKTLYNMGQFSAATLGDLWFRSVQHLVLHDTFPSFQMVGEGDIALQAIDLNQGASTQDVLGLWVNLTSIPATVARRGVTFQRLYGVGSVEWNVASPSNPIQLIAQRDAIHYESQFIAAPAAAQAYRVRWRLQPGVAATAWQIGRNSDNPFYVGPAPYDQAYQWFNNWHMPPGWTDPPIYPAGSSSPALPSGGGLPPALFPCCS